MATAILVILLGAFIVAVIFLLFAGIYLLFRVVIGKPGQRVKKDRMGATAVMDPAFRETLRILMEEGSGHVSPIARELFAKSALKGEYNEARKMLQSVILPSLNKATYDKVMTAGGGESWANWDDVTAANLLHNNDSVPMDTLFLGNIPGESQYNPEIRFTGEGHVMTIAPTGAGKGQRYILPNTFKYHGPILCVDPKGENYKTTARRRDSFGKVYKFSPFDEDTDCFNPLDFIKSWEDARQIAELLVIPQGGASPFGIFRPSHWYAG
jgi:type IV secretion system protein VirD4